MNAQAIKTGFLFWLHLMAVFATWVLPFLINWKLAVGVYSAVVIQFAVFGKCLMNEHHGLKEEGDRIFYTDVMERLGLRPNHRTVKVVVRQFLYPVLIVVTLLYQVWLGNTPLLF